MAAKSFAPIIAGSGGVLLEAPDTLPESGTLALAVNSVGKMIPMAFPSTTRETLGLETTDTPEFAGLTSTGIINTDSINSRIQGKVFFGWVPGQRGMALDDSGFYFKHIDSGRFDWSSTSNVNSATDTQFKRVSAGNLGIYTGDGTTPGGLVAGAVTASTGTFSGEATASGFRVNNPSSQRPVIRWNPLETAFGLSFVSNATEVCRIQDNGSVVSPSFETIGGLRSTGTYMQRGTSGAALVYESGTDLEIRGGVGRTAWGVLKGGNATFNGVVNVGSVNDGGTGDNVLGTIKRDNQYNYYYIDSGSFRLGSSSVQRWFPTINVLGAHDIELGRGATGPTYDVRCAGGLRSRNLNNTADAPITASTGRFGGAIVVPSGSFASPGIQFLNENSGIYRADNDLVFKTGNGEKLRLLHPNIYRLNGADPELAFVGVSQSIALHQSRIAFRNANNTAHCAITAGAGTFSGTVTTNQFLSLNSLARLSASTYGKILLDDAGHATGGPTVQFGGTTSSHPAIKRSGTTLKFRLADDSADAPVTASSFSSPTSELVQVSSNGGSLLFNSYSGGGTRASVYHNPSRLELCLKNDSYSANEAGLALDSTGNLLFRNGAVYNSSPVFQVSNAGALTGRSATFSNTAYPLGSVKIKQADNSAIFPGSTAANGIAFCDYSGGQERLGIVVGNDGAPVITGINAEQIRFGLDLNLKAASSYTVKSLSSVGFASRNLTDSADAPITAGAGTFSGNVDLSAESASLICGRYSGARLVSQNGDLSIHSGGNRTHLIGQNAGGIAMTSNQRISWSSGASDAYSGHDARIVRNTTAQLDIRADSGLRIRNFANDADAPITAGAGTFSGSVEFGASLLITTGVVRPGYGTSVKLGQSFSTSNDNFSNLYLRGNGIVGFGDQAALASPSAGTIEVNNGTAGQTRDLSLRGTLFRGGPDDPTATDIPAGVSTLWNNTTTSELKLWANVSGTLKSVLLS